jgi:uncharacterized damage-inducible protein DinB
MSIGLERSLRHMAWANQRVFAAVSELPDEALKSFIVNPEWTANKILRHICGGATWYVYRLEIEDWQDIPKVNTTTDIKGLAVMLAGLDAKLISAVHQEDREIDTEVEGEMKRVWASTILSQAVHHSDEHRAQLIDALEYKGYKPINLDDIDLWAFEGFERKK